jgi:fatty acid desaturase
MTLKKDDLKPLASYAQVLSKEIEPELFRPHPRRLFWVLGFCTIIFFVAVLFVKLDLSLFSKLSLSVLLGLTYGTMAFLSHELLHGSIIRNRPWQNFLAFFTFMPFLVSPTFWRFWHNNLHHGNTQALLTDPDAFPSIRIFGFSRFMQRMFPFTPGSGHKRSLVYFLFWFSFHVFVAQVYLRFRNKVFDSLNHSKVNREWVLQLMIWLIFLICLGPENLVYTFFIPFLIQNYVIMSYVATNHNLSPLTKVNDPLVNSLTVTNKSVLEFFHLNFGYHVEHHIFPTMSAVHAKKIHNLLKSKFPERYQFMPKREAIRKLYETPRIYKDSTTLIHPMTGQTAPTLAPYETL